MMMRQTIGLSLALLFVSTAAMAQKAESAKHDPAPNTKTKSAGLAKTNGAPKRARNKAVAHAERRRVPQAQRQVAALPPPDEYIGAVRVVGQREVGSAAWYGGHHLGHRTASGDRLDAVRATAAHRSLPLYSLARITNLNNGRTVVVKITDRGPVSRSLLIDVSPRAAAALDMLNSGIAQVAIEPVAPATPTASAH